MHLQAVHFLIHVQTLRQQRHLLLHPRRVEFHLQFGQPVTQPLADTGETIDSPEDGPLGPDAFGDIQFPAVARAITGARWSGPRFFGLQ